MNNTMNEEPDFHIPSEEEFRRGYQVYNERENRGFVYFEALGIVTTNWGDAELMAKGIQRLIRSWNRFYAKFSLSDLTRFLVDNMECLNIYKSRHIFDFSETDDAQIRQLFRGLLQALKREADGALSPVSVAKAFGLLAPNFLPIWDSNIAYGYNCFYFYFSDMADSPYLRFCRKMRVLAARVQHFVPQPDNRALLKRIDEYNYSKYTMHWI
jgi:hypothetical protein